METDHAADMLAGFYTAGAGLSDWRSALEPLRQHVGAHRVMLLGLSRSNPSPGLVFEAGEAGLDNAQNAACPDEPDGLRWQRLMELPRGEWLHCNENQGGGCARHDPWCRNPCQLPQPSRISYCKLLDTDQQAVLWAVWHGSQAHSPRPAADDEHTRFLLAHLAKALGLYLRDQEARSTAAAALEVLHHLRQPMLLVDRERRIHFINHTARQLFDKGTLLQNRQGTLQCTNAHDNLRLAQALQDLPLNTPLHPTCDGASARKSVVRLTPGKGLSGPAALCISPLRPNKATAQGPGMALLTAHDPAMRQPLDAQLAADIWGLSPAEARVAIGVAQGHSLAELARSTGLSLSTLRSQVQSAMVRTDTHRQADLVSLILQAPPSAEP